MLECVINISEGRDEGFLSACASGLGRDFLDLHSDPDHHRSVFTLAGEEAARVLATEVVAVLDIGQHSGVHPRIGTVDVVPFVPIHGSTIEDALAARDRFAYWVADHLGVPCFLYGPERSLPEIRRGAWRNLRPDVGPDEPHPLAGAMCVGARQPLIAYNVWLAGSSRDEARRIAADLRGPHVRALGLQVGDQFQVSMNLISPEIVGPAEAFDAVASRARVDRAELVGLLPAAALAAISRARWGELDVSVEQTIEWRLAHRPNEAFA